MYVQTRTGAELYNLSKLIWVKVIDETQLLRELHPETLSEMYSIQAKLPEGNIYLAKYDNATDAYAAFSDFIAALAESATIFSFNVGASPEIEKEDLVDEHRETEV